MTQEIIERKRARLETLKYTVQTTREDADKTLAHLTNFGFEERILEIVRNAFGKREHAVNSEIGAIKKQIGLPTQSEIKKSKKESVKILSEDAKRACWISKGETGKEPLKWFRLIDHSTSYLKNQLDILKIDRPSSDYIPIIKEILESRSQD